MTRFDIVAFANLKKFYRKYQNFFAYTFFGTLASAINVVLFHILEKDLGFNYLIANCLAYIVAIILLS